MAGYITLHVLQISLSKATKNRRIKTLLYSNFIINRERNLTEQGKLMRG